MLLDDMPGTTQANQFQSSQPGNAAPGALGFVSSLSARAFLGLGYVTKYHVVEAPMRSQFRKQGWEKAAAEIKVLALSNPTITHSGKIQKNLCTFIRGAG